MIFYTNGSPLSANLRLCSELLQSNNCPTCNLVISSISNYRLSRLFIVLCCFLLLLPLLKTLIFFTLHDINSSFKQKLIIIISSAKALGFQVVVAERVCITKHQCLSRLHSYTNHSFLYSQLHCWVQLEATCTV